MSEDYVKIVFVLEYFTSWLKYPYKKTMDVCNKSNLCKST